MTVLNVSGHRRLRSVALVIQEMNIRTDVSKTTCKLIQEGSKPDRLDTQLLLLAGMC
jgi:hypothetical protein